MRQIFLAALLATSALAAPAQTQLQSPQKTITEKIEWTWSDRPETPNPSLPCVLLEGDSITRGYYPAVQDQLKGIANVYLFATSASSGDPRLPGQLHDYLAMIAVQFAVIHFNNGMHGWGYTEPQYAASLPAMVSALRTAQPQARLIWASTTPVLRDSTNGESTNARLDARNRLAAALMAARSIPLDDQHALMLAHPDLHDGDVHFTTEGSALQATQVASTIRDALAKAAARP
jgi:hypothetical protein